MLSTGAYRSEHDEVLAAWQQYRSDSDAVFHARRAMADHYGRELWVQRLGFGHGTRIVGFEELPTDPEDMPPELRKNLTTGRVGPNLRRKAGRELESKLRRLDWNGPVLPGMPPWTLVGLHSLSPAIDWIDGAIYVNWDQDIEASTQAGQIDHDLWKPIRLSVYYRARERVAVEG